MLSFFALSDVPYRVCVHGGVFSNSKCTHAGGADRGCRPPGRHLCCVAVCDGLKLGRKVVQLEVFFSRVARQHSSGSPWRAAGANAALHRPEIPPRADLSEAERIHANCEQGREDSV